MKFSVKQLFCGTLVVLSILSAPSASADCSKLSVAGVKACNVDLYRAKGGYMKLDMDLVLDSLKLGSNDQITIRPALVSESDTAVFTPVTIYGRNQLIKLQRNPGMAMEGAREVKRVKGNQSVDYEDAVSYADWMQYCSLVMYEDKCGCGRFQDSACSWLADIDNRPAGDAVVCYITPQAEAVKDRDESGQAFLDFIVNKTNIEPNYRNNRRELDKIIGTINLVKNDPFVTITNVNIHGFASPEGPYDNNTRLASGRAAALKDYIKSLYDMPDRVFTSNSTPEDWETLRRMVDESSLPERQAILDIIDSSMDYDAKDHEIRRQMPQTYNFILKEWYPGLRRSDYKVSYVVRPLTIEEAKQVLETNPKNLSLNEMFLVAQTYQPGSPEFNRVFEIAARVFPDDPTANLNAACTELTKGDLQAAERYLAKAGDSPEAIHARGILELDRNNFAEARRLLTAAKNGGVAQAVGNLEILDRKERIAKANEER